MLCECSYQNHLKMYFLFFYSKKRQSLEKTIEKNFDKNIFFHLPKSVCVIKKHTSGVSSVADAVPAARAIIIRADFIFFS